MNHQSGDLFEVSIPFRADTGFEPQIVVSYLRNNGWVSIPFRADTGFEHEGVWIARLFVQVSIPFRADTGFEQKALLTVPDDPQLFQSLSGLTLGLNRRRDMTRQYKYSFQSLSGLTLGLNAR